MVYQYEFIKEEAIETVDSGLIKKEPKLYQNKELIKEQNKEAIDRDNKHDIVANGVIKVAKTTSKAVKDVAKKDVSIAIDEKDIKDIKESYVGKKSSELSEYLKRQAIKRTQKKEKDKIKKEEQKEELAIAKHKGELERTTKKASYFAKPKRVIEYKGVKGKKVAGTIDDRRVAIGTMQQRNPFSDQKKIVGYTEDGRPVYAGGFNEGFKGLSSGGNPLGGGFGMGRGSSLLGNIGNSGKAPSTSLPSVRTKPIKITPKHRPLKSEQKQTTPDFFGNIGSSGNPMGGFGENKKSSTKKTLKSKNKNIRRKANKSQEEDIFGLKGFL